MQRQPTQNPSSVPCTISCKLPAASLAFDRAAWVGHGAAITADPSALIAPAGASNLDCFRFRRIRADRTNSLQGAEPPIASAQLQYSPHLATAVPYQDPYQLSLSSLNLHIDFLSIMLPARARRTGVARASNGPAATTQPLWLRWLCTTTVLIAKAQSLMKTANLQQSRGAQSFRAPSNRASRSQ